MDLTWLPLTSQGFMVGDYESTSFSGGQAFPVFAVANAPAGSVLDEALFTVAGGFSVIAAGAGTVTQSGATSTSSATSTAGTNR